MESRRNIKSRLAAREKEQKEAELREMAAKSRMARAGLAVGAADDDDAPRDEAPRYEQREDGEEREDDEGGVVREEQRVRLEVEPTREHMASSHESCAMWRCGL